MNRPFFGSNPDSTTDRGILGYAARLTKSGFVAHKRRKSRLGRKAKAGLNCLPGRIRTPPREVIPDIESSHSRHSGRRVRYHADCRPVP